MKDFRLLLVLLSSVLFGLTSCDEKDGASEYDNWKERNTQYIDSIATVARANADGNWRVILAEGLNAEAEWPNEYYVFCYSLQTGSGTESPMYSDSVAVNYSGRLIPTPKYKDGYLFDSSYSGKFDPSFDTPVALELSSLVHGLGTALLHMVKGDTWRVYIPNRLGYGNEAAGNVPAYSALIFEINLVEFSPIGVPLPKN